MDMNNRNCDINDLIILSIVVDDFDTGKVNEDKNKTQENETKADPIPHESIRQILNEAEQRKLKFWKLIDEYSDVVEKVKKIEQKEQQSTHKSDSNGKQM
ncbi:PREDICTED: uncharacterized protein LOC108561672 isoform X2 [Nicrophorus vespilloides]|uniref:Uncharacterized protein LOC108561672 isoform X2 n=1 Tax=Nicrophorus vespilloides TaxID=110193 RepID=A0ABM1MKV7_NICVS|nr:PREDICTED: uncharacterized protein LOC108561672 isoform X2 [Nicrophorus vespilloides]